MVEIEINGEKQPCIFSAWTAVLYEQEFKSDLYGDMYSGVAILAEKQMEDEKAGGKAAKKADAAKKHDGLLATFERVDSATMYRVLWAALKAANDDVPPFSEWSRGEIDLNRFEVVGLLLGECNRRCFRAGAGDSE